MGDAPCHGTKQDSGSRRPSDVMSVLAPAIASTTSFLTLQPIAHLFDAQSSFSIVHVHVGSLTLRPPQSCASRRLWLKSRDQIVNRLQSGLCTRGSFPGSPNDLLLIQWGWKARRGVWECLDMVSCCTVKPFTRLRVHRIPPPSAKSGSIMSRHRIE